MAQLHYITAAQAAAAEGAPLGVNYGNFYSQRREDFFFEYVREQLVHRYGAKAVAQGGLKVYTTIDLNMQRLARKAIANVLNQPEDPASAIVTLNPHNGDIEAMAESESYEKSQYNLAADGHRQPGSTFKAIDLADALSRGVDPNSTYYLSHTLAPGWLAGYPTYEVKTFEGTSLNKSMNLVKATLASDNTVYAQLAADLGEQTITQMAYKMGVKTHLSSFPAEALGGLTLGVTPLEMADVYATLADGGWRNTPIAITKVVFPDGHVDENWGKPHRVKVLSEARHRGGDEHPAAERPERHRDPLGDQLPHRRQDRHHQRTRRRLAGRLHAQLLDGRVDGLPEQARLDDRRARRAPAGRLPAGGNLARVHVGGHRRPALRAVPRSRGNRSPTRRSSANSRRPGQLAGPARPANRRQFKKRPPKSEHQHHASGPASGPTARRAHRPTRAESREPPELRGRRRPPARTRPAHRAGGGTTNRAPAGRPGGLATGNALRAPSAGSLSLDIETKGRSRTRGGGPDGMQRGEGGQGRIRGRGDRGPAQRDVPREARQRPRRARARGRQDAALPDPHPAGRPRALRALPLRPGPRADRLPASLSAP